MADSPEDPGEQLGNMVVEWAEAYWDTQAPELRHYLGSPSDLRPVVLKAFTAGAVTVFQRWDEVRPLVPRKRPSRDDLPTHHG